ncbi:MAG: extracellular solute-binding protein [Clostridia bacterium]|nr:extracellular solute-binding protein [Clostridia bacterium]
MKKKNLSVVLAGMMLASAGFTACNKVADDENTLEIRVVSLGYGHQYLEELKKKFVAANPDTNIEIVATIEQDEGVILTAGPKANTADLMLGTYPYFEEVDNGAGVVKGYDHVLEDLTSFLDETTYSDGTTLRERFLPYFVEALQQEVEINGEWEVRDYRLSYAASVLGIVYNKDLFAVNNWELPNTTMELWALADEIKGKGIIPFVNDTAVGYMTYFGYTMFAQYMGVDDYYDYYRPTSIDDFYKYLANSDSYARLYALEELNRMQNPSYGRLSPYATQDDYGRSQARLVSGEGAMGVNGDWFEREMSIVISQAQETGKYQKGTGFMQFPVVSALSDKLSYWNELVNSNGIANTYYDAELQPTELADQLEVADKLLSMLVDYVDGGKTGELPSIAFEGKTYSTTTEDAEIVEAARKVVSSIGPSHALVIPAYATAKELAKKFVAYMYSDEGIEICMQYMNGGMLPVKTDFTKIDGYEQRTGFQKEVYSFVQNATIASYPQKVLDWKINGLPDPSARFHAHAMDSEKYVSPYDTFVSTSLTKAKFETLMYNAGLI